jgi:hypothetical protein
MVLRQVRRFRIPSSAAFVKCSNKTGRPLEPTYSDLCDIYVTSGYNERSTSQADIHPYCLGAVLPFAQLEYGTQTSKPVGNQERGLPQAAPVGGFTSVRLEPMDPLDTEKGTRLSSFDEPVIPKKGPT